MLSVKKRKYAGHFRKFYEYHFQKNVLKWFRTQAARVGAWAQGPPFLSSAINSITTTTETNNITNSINNNNNSHEHFHWATIDTAIWYVCTYYIQSIYNSPFKNSLPLFGVHVHVGTGNYANLLTTGNFAKYVLFLLQNLLEIIHLYHNHYTYSYWKPT